MSKKETKTVKLYFRRAPKGTGYHAGRVYDVPAEKAKVYKDAGYANDPTQTLPKDFPYREALIAGGYETLEEVKDAKDLTKIKDIGPASEKEIAEYLKENS